MLSLSSCDPQCLGHAQTHIHCDSTHAQDALLRLAGRGQSIQDKDDEREESQVVSAFFFFFTFLSVQIKNVVEISTVSLSGLCITMH